MSGVAQTASVTTYKYDPDGNRVSKNVDGTTTRYLVDSYNPTGYAQVFTETTGSNVKCYIIGDDVLAQATNTDNPQYLLYDGHGSTRQLMASNVNTVNDSFSYDAYGIMLGGNPHTPAATNLLYTGEQWDTSAQMYYNRARYYNPSNGLFNQVDPYSGSRQDPQSLHKYLYSHANPINNIDPSGMMDFSLTGMLQVAAITGLISANVAGWSVALKGGTTQQVLSAVTKWFWIGFVAGGAGYGGAWAINSLWLYLTGGGVITAQQAAQEGFRTPQDLVNYWRGLGANGQIHHFVQQTQANIAKFGSEAIHSKLNSIPVPPSWHLKIIHSFTQSAPETVKLNPAEYGNVSHMYEYIQGLSWEMQYKWGVAMYNYVVQNGTLDGFNKVANKLR